MTIDLRAASSRPGRRAGAALALALALAAAPSLANAACGSPGGDGSAGGVDDRGEIALADQRVARLAGLDLPLQGPLAASARDFIAARALGLTAALIVFAPSPDRWGRTLADLSAPQGAGEPGSLAEALLAAGLARVRPEFETRGCEARRLALEAARARKSLASGAIPTIACSPPTTSRNWRGAMGVSSLSKGW